ncbi:ATP-binding protein [Streptomyces canus]|uniref:ATP-binding protein n=1 Tax=Streptomyces canus TaxID=58343 RepID=UPI0027838769|nr:XRE family transcriptional regulator [Streptomyces canus]MDQ0767043.1 tetratricopeptide (TPR) repeat protein/transcriptional regulator with XRE-family HTH domain [Streptomyces canus]MDQ1065080.1 tetratricopeptide (TPR) repeat protein/transcriptional regulator with XRE-family HTH domain [Streptomyces canus]
MGGGGEDFGALLRQLRLNVFLTLEGLAEASGVSVRGIGDLERGRRAAPQRRTVAALADGLRLDAEQRDRLLAAARAGRVDQPTPVSVRTFPRDVDDFVGRRGELVSLTTLAAGLKGGGAGTTAPSSSGPGPVVMIVSGSPGMGKTALVLHAAQELAKSFPDGQMMLDLRGMDESPPSPAELMLGVLKAFHVADSDLMKAGPHGHAALYQDLLADRRCLLIFDNARDEAQVRQLLPARGRAMVLVTSRRVLTGLRNVHRIGLGELAPDEAIAFLAGMIGEERAARESSALSQVARQCGYLPLALRMAGSWLATRTGWSVQRLADRLAVDGRRLEALVAGDRKVSVAFDLSYQQLTPDAARLFRRLSLVPGPDAGSACAAQLLGQDLPSAEDILDELVETGLLGTHGDRFRLHDLLRLYAGGRLATEEGPERVEQLRTDLYRWLLETTIVAGRWFEPDHGAPPVDWHGLVDLSSADLARQWLQSQGINWLAALGAMADAGEHALVVEVAESLHWFSDQWIFWGHWTEVFSLAARSAQALGDDVLRATQLNYHAWTLIVCEGSPEDSLPVAREALSAAERGKDSRQQAWAYYYLGWAQRVREFHEEAAEYYSRAIPLFASVGDLHGSLQARHGFAHNLLLQGEGAAALHAFQRILTFLDESGELIEPYIAETSRIGVTSGMGRSLGLLDQWDEAVAYVRDAVSLSDGLGNLPVKSLHLLHLGDVLLSAGRADEAREAFRTCLALGGDADPHVLADAHRRLDRLDDAT